MADGTIQLPGDSTGKILDTSDISFGAGSTSRHRERIVVGDPSSTTGLATVTSSAGLQVTITSGVVTATAGTNPWSSAPGFNVPIVSVSSGLTQISGTVTVLSASSGLVQISGTPTVTATAGTNPWSSAPGFNVPIVSVSSGLVQISGTVTVLSASSGLVQISGIPLVGVTTSVFSGIGLVTSGMTLLGMTTGYVPVLIVTTSGGTTTVTTSFGPMAQLTTGKIVPVLSASSGTVSIDLWQGSSSFAPSFITGSTISKISSAPGTLHLLTGFTTSTGGIGATIPALLRLYNNTTSNVTMNSSVRGILPLGMQSSSTSLTGGGDVSNPLMLANFSPIGMYFSSGCSFDIVFTATSTAAVAGSGYITVLYSTV